MFRRHSSDAPEVLDSDQPEAENGQVRARPGLTPKKGVPTPKRSEAQGNRRQPYQAPADRKASSQQSRTERARRTEAYQRGEEWALPPKDRGPVRALARDVVDARRGIGEFYMPIVILLIVLLFVPGTATKLVADVVVVALLVLIVIESMLVGGKIKKLAAERYPGQSTRGIVGYALMRGLSMRKMRVPKPRVSRGDKV